MDVTVCVATFGADWWAELAASRAVPSAEALDVPVVHVHGKSLHEARNGALGRVWSEWVCFLDADDQLEPGYFDAMAAGTADVRAPAVRYVRPDLMPVVPYVPRVAGHEHDCAPACLPEGNWLVVGSVARAELVRKVGGWRDFPWSEDWDLWLRCYLAGASLEAVPAAVYRAHVRRDSRNRGQSHAAKMAAHKAIYAANFPEVLT